jgi:hypothetical protein
VCAACLRRTAVQYDGVRETRIFMGVQGRVFDVSTGSDFYGPGGGYSVLAGRVRPTASHTAERLGQTPYCDWWWCAGRKSRIRRHEFARQGEVGGGLPHPTHR